MIMTYHTEIGINVFWIRLVELVLELHNDGLSQAQIVERMRSIESTFLEQE